MRTKEEMIFDWAEKLHWIKLDANGTPEFYLDNHMMQTFRACEAKFWHEFVEGWSGSGRVWFLDFGIITHKCIEQYYLDRKKPGFDIFQWAGAYARSEWDKLDMDGEYSTHPDYTKLGGFGGFAAMLCQYAQHFNAENERFRVIGAELYFGKSKEVPLLDNHLAFEFAPFRLYLSGKIDLLVDDGHSIGPMDHKTARDFRGGNPMASYEVQEGMTGYVFAAKKIIENIQGIDRKPCNKIWMNFIQVKGEKVLGDRFKRMPLYKSDAELEDYRLRMISTVSRIYQLLTNPELKPNWNTMMCNNYMHNTCAFQAVHRQKDAQSQLLVLQSQFVKKEIWNPEKI
jgi:hypothetical protein